ncbi:MAG TPA: PAS domain S-box protein [Caulobacter sp.]|nr:PAS domain S-box protein [Caulobacter sp.]
MSSDPRDAESFRRLIESISDYAIYMLDPQGRITNWNRGAQQIKGYSAEEVVGSHFSRFFTPEDAAAGLPGRGLATALAEGRFEAEAWRVRKDGTRFWANVVVDPIYDDEGRHIGFAKITRDMTERKAAQEALARSEREFRLLVAGVIDYALYMLDTEGRVSTWNSGAEKIKGYSAEEIIGQHFSRFYTPADREAGRPAHALAKAAEEGRYEAEAWRVRKDGSLFWANVVIDPVRDETGELIGFAKITRDITERRNAQLELDAARERLAQAQKMEALGQLTGGVAHDFNNLLMVVTGQVELLRRRIGHNPAAVRSLEAIEAAARRGQDLTRHLLAFARRQRLQPAPLALSDRAEALKELLSTSIGSTSRLHIDLPSTLWTVEVDVSELELSLLNLVVNARDAMPGGGDISISARNLVLDPVEDGSGLAGDFVAITVRDSGQGIPPDILARIFEPFFTTKEVDKGTGLGLSQVYGFAEQSGGRVTVESRLGEGAAFTLILPRSLADPTARDPRAGQMDPVAGVRILVVEDNPEVAEVAAGLLEQLGNQVETVTNAENALAAIKAGGLPDLVFSDIVMAGEMDGLALARRLRTEHPSLPILLATGYSRSGEDIGGEFMILPKPYQLADLSGAISTLLAKRPL